MTVKSTHTLAARADREERLTRGYRLLLAGKSYEHIAEQIGYSDRHNCRRALLGYVKKRTEELNEAADDALTLLLDQLDTIIAPQFGRARAGDGQAFDRALRGLAQKAKLQGLDRGPTINVETVVTGSDLDADIVRLRDVLQGRAIEITGEPVPMPALSAVLEQAEVVEGDEA